MKQRTAARILKWMGWTVEGGLPEEKKCIILGAPHTSIIDFFVSYLFYRSIGGFPRIMVKKEFFRFPLSRRFLLRLGAIPVDRSTTGGAAAIKSMIAEFDRNDTFHLAMSPEGTRSPVTRWKSGFHRIARAVNVPVYTGFFDWKTKTIGAGEKMEMTDDIRSDMRRVRQWYKDKGVVGRHPEKFLVGDDLD